MAKRLGIACDLEIRKFELEQEYKNTRGWRSTPPFPTRQEAEQWLESKAAELSCKIVAISKTSSKNPKTSSWYGFLFEHDGPK